MSFDAPNSTVKLIAKGKNLMSVVELSDDSWYRICKAYEISNRATVTPISISENRTYQISLANGVKQVLRIYHSSTEIEEIKSELMVLEYLSRVAYLKVPSPIATHEGRLSMNLYENEKPEPTQTAIFSFVTGKAISGMISEEMMFQTGQTLGKLDTTLQNLDLAMNPSPSQFRSRWNGKNIINYSVAELIQHHQDYEFLSNYTYDGGLESILLDIANRLQIHYRKIKFVLPYQLIHGDAHFDNLVFDGTTIGIFDFDNLGFAPRIYELAAPLNHLYELELWHKKITNSKRLGLLTKALLDGYMEQVKLSNWELASLPLLQAIHLFGVLGWTIKQQDSSKCQLWLRENFAVGLEQILIFLDIYEKSFILSRFKILQQISWKNQKNLLRFYTLKIWQRSKKILKILAVKI